MTKGATGTVNVTVNGVSYNLGLVNSQAVVYVKGLTKGEYDIKAVYNGDDRYYGSSNMTAKVIVSTTDDFDMRVIASNTTVGGQSVVEIILPSDAKGTVTIGDITENVVNGRATITLPKEISAGGKKISVVYNGDNDRYDSKSIGAGYNVAKSTSAISINVEDIYYVGDKIVITLTPTNSTGAITVTINGENYTVKDNKVTIPKGLDADSYTVVANLAEDNNYKSSDATATFDVIKHASSISIDVKDVFVVDENIVITLTGENVSDVSLTINGKSYAVKGNKVTIPKGLANGTYLVTAKFAGDNKYLGSESNATFKVNKVTPTKVSAKDLTFIVSNKGILEISGPIDRSASLVVNVDGTDYYIKLTDGKANLDVSRLNVGEYDVSITYLENDKYVEREFSDVSTITVKDKSDSNMKVDIDVDNGTITVELPENATGNVTVVIDGKEYEISDACDSPIIIDIGDVPPGNHNIEVIYSGDDNFNNATFADDVKVPKEDDYELDINVAVDEDKAVIDINLPDDVNDVVLVDVDGRGYLVNVTNGKGKLELSGLSGGNHTVTVKYPGNEKYAPNENTTDFTIKGHGQTPMDINAGDINVGDDLIVEVVVPKDAKGNIVLDINGKTYLAPINNGIAKFNITGLEEGNYTVKATFAGDGKYPANSTETTVEVSKVEHYPIDVSVDGRDIIVKVPEDAQGNVTVTIEGKNYTAKVENGTAIINVPDLTPGKHNITVSYGDEKYSPEENSTVIDVVNELIINAPEVVKYYSGPERFYVYLEDLNGKIANASVSIKINGVTYNRTTDENGAASIALKLISGKYPVTVIFNGNKEFNKTTISSNVTINPTIYAKDVFKVFKNGTHYYALFVDGEGKPLVNTVVSFNINGVFYNRTTNATGWAKLNINLPKGKYILTAINPVTNEMRTNIVTVITQIVENNDLVKYYRNASQFTVRIVLADGSYAGEGEEVTFNINGVFYKRYTDANGYALLNINLLPGDYIITSYYKDCRESNSIKVLPVLFTKDLKMKYMDGSHFTAHLLDGQGNAYPNQVVSYNVNGVFYNRLTDENGDSNLLIRLLPGEYIITSSYNELNASNKITIS